MDHNIYLTQQNVIQMEERNKVRHMLLYTCIIVCIILIYLHIVFKSSKIIQYNNITI